MKDDIRSRASFDLIRYANVWEDADILCEALAPAPGKRIASIASGGDNAFALLAEGADVLAVDISPAQLHLVELKREAIRRLDDAALLAFLGIRESSNREDVWKLLRGELSSDARDYWDRNVDVIRNGVAHGGKFERYFRMFRTRVLPLVHGRRRTAELLAPKSLEEQGRFYTERWDGWRWRSLFAFFFSRFVMGQLGRDPEFFRYVEGSVADRIRGRAEYAMTALPTHSNPYLKFIMSGNYGDALPRYLRADRLALVRRNLDRLTLVRGAIQDAVRASGQKYDGYNLSDIFEYLDAPTCEALYRSLLDDANPGARFAYWNMLVPRRAPASLQHRVDHLAELSADLFRRDLAFFYSAFIVEEVKG
jgi:S-adenosylmethionine-diacylglycerol 3-amino-3-carboxypropyl transferase